MFARLVTESCVMFAPVLTFKFWTLAVTTFANWTFAVTRLDEATFMLVRNAFVVVIAFAAQMLPPRPFVYTFAPTINSESGPPNEAWSGYPAVITT